MKLFIPLLLVAALVLIFILRRLVRKKNTEILVSIYINLVELYGYHFWMVSLPRCETDPEILEKVRTLLNITRDNLHRIRGLRIARETLAVLNQLTRDKTPEAAVRYNNLALLIKKLEEYISSKYPQAAHRIAEVKSNDILNAAGFINWKPKSHWDHRP